MSPRRMDISSLLRDPSPPPRSTDDLPASLLAILNTPTHRSPPDRPPFLGLDALVHVASEEHRRISAVADRDLVHDHDRPYGYPLQDNARPHKRPRDSCPPSPPRSPSPHTFPLVPAQPTSPSTRLHPSASPLASNSYPTLRRQPVLHMEPTRVAPIPPSLSLQHTSPFFPPHSSPRNNSPHRHSPQLLRSQLHSSPIQTGSLISASAEADAMSPRYGYGPRMAGGIQVLSNDVRDSPRPDFSNYQSPRRDLSTERLPSESHAEHARHEHPKLSPLSARAFSLDDDRYQLMAPSFRVEGQETMVHRERVQSRPPHLSLVDPTMDNAKRTGIPAKEADFPARHPPERHPHRVWEEQPSARDASRRVSPVRMPGIAPSVPQGRAWSGASESRYDERPANDDEPTVLRQNVVENAPTPPLPTCMEPLPPRQPTPDPLTGLQTTVQGSRLDPQPSLPISMQSGPQARPSQTSLLNPSTPHVPTSPVLDLHLKNFETQSELQPERPEAQVDASTSAPLTPSDPTVTEPVLGRAELMPGAVDADTSLVANSLPRRPSPELVQPMLAWEPGSLMSMHSTPANVSQSTSRSPSQQPLPIHLSAKDEHVSPLKPPPEPTSRRSPEPEHTTDRKPPVSEQTTMDVDEELLSLVEDRPVRAIPSLPKAQIDSTLPLPITVGQAPGARVDQGPNGASDGPSLVPSSQPVLKGALMTAEEKDRASMPPPTARSKKVEKDKPTLAPGAATGSKKKKDGASKPAVKPKQPPKPRAKPVPKPKARPNVVDTSSKAVIPKVTVNANARSRSTSVIPVAVDDVVPEPEVDNSDKEDDKLYCVCKTRYDEDRMMIACDRCDEWLHTLCVNMPDLEIDLVDQFICPPCIQKHPHLRTTWKRRCLFGLQHQNPSSLEACHKPSRGAFSKYCSDDCGIKYMQARIAQWEKSGGVRDLLWESVKNAAKREGVVVCAVTDEAGPGMDVNNSESEPLDSAAKRRAEREAACLNARLKEVVKERELMKRELDMVIWREKVVELASERAGKVAECGWDQRLCFGEEEWADFGSEVLESYEEERVKVESGDDAIPLDAVSALHGEWWCTGKKKCERHSGWQKLRAAEVSFDKETKEGILLKLTTREREIRKCIEDILYPQPTGSLQAPPHPEVQLNGCEKPRSTDHVSEEGGKGHRSCV